MTTPVGLKLYGEQYNILQDWLTTDKNCMDIVPVGSGKTFLASIALPLFANNPNFHKGKDIIYSAPTTSMIKSLIWEPLKNSVINYYNLVDGRDINNSELTIKFPNGIFIRCKSAEQKENLRGLNVGVWVADEAALYSSSTLQEITNRLRPKVGEPDTKGRFIIISTPNGNGPLFDLYNFAKTSNDWIVRHYNYGQMRSGNLDFINKQKQVLSPLKFAQDYLCHWESVEDMFFYAWNSSYINDTKDNGGDLYIGCDFNKRVMNTVVANVYKPGKLDGKIEVIKSYSIPDCGTERMAQEIRKDFNKRNIYAVIDMSGTQVNRDTTSPFGVTDRTILEKYGITIINSKKSNPLIIDTDNSSNSFIQRGGLVVPSHCKKLIEALNSYHYEDSNRKKLVKSTEKNYAHIDGLGDATRYLIHHFFPITHNINTVDYVTDNKVSRPGDEYRRQSPLYPGGPTWTELLSHGSEDSDYVTW
jgi:hypothetical protein